MSFSVYQQSFAENPLGSHMDVWGLRVCRTLFDIKLFTKTCKLDCAGTLQHMCNMLLYSNRNDLTSAYLTYLLCLLTCC